MRRCRFAFTLIELLVVMAIIGILAGMLFPIFGAMRTRAKITKARHEAGQIDTAWKSYQMKERSLPALTDMNTAGAWAYLVPYIETTNLMRIGAAGVPTDPWGVAYKVLFGDPDRDIKVWSCGPDTNNNCVVAGGSLTNGGDDVCSW